MSNFLSDKSYIALKPQSAAATPVIPNAFFPLLSESIKVNLNFTADRRMKGLDWKSDELLKGSRKIEGDITVLADPEVLGHLLNMAYAKGSTTGNGTDGYTHPFTPGDGKSYSIDIPRGNYAQRIWGARAENLRIEFVDNKMQATVSIKALGQFYAASLGIALSGASTSIVLSTDYDLRPADGLVVGDILTVVKDDASTVDLTLTSVNADGKTVGFVSTSITAAVGNAVFLKAQTASFGTSREPFYFGNTLVGFAATSSAADTAAASRTTATPCYKISTNFKNNLLDAPATGYTGPAVLLTQVKEADFEISSLFTDPTSFQKWIESVKRAATVIATGRFIKSDQTTSEKLTIKYHKLKNMDVGQPLNAGAYLFDEQKFDALYDTSDTASVEISLVNRTAGTSY